MDSLEIHRESILKTKLGSYLNKIYLESQEKDKREIKEIWSKTYTKNINSEILRKREDLLKDLKISSFIDENVIIGNSILKQISSKLQDSKIITTKNVFSNFKNYFKEENTIAVDNLNGEALKEVISNVNNSNHEFLIGIGGGRTLDYLKYIAMKTNTFCIAIPSSLTTHVYTSPKLTISQPLLELGETTTIDCPVPNLAIIDTNFLIKLNKDKPRLIRAGLGDVMVCITALEDWKLAAEKNKAKLNNTVIKMLNLVVETLNKMNVERSLKDWIEDYIFIQTLLCRISGWVGSAPVSGSEHLFAIALEENNSNPPLHGELVALGAIIMTYIQEKDYKRVSQLARKLKLPISLSEIGISTKQAIQALQNTKKIAQKKGRFTIIDTLEMNKEYCMNVLNSLLDKNIILK